MVCRVIYHLALDHLFVGMLRVARIKDDKGDYVYIGLDRYGVPVKEPFRSRHLELVKKMEDTKSLCLIAYELVPFGLAYRLATDGDAFLQYSV